MSQLTSCCICQEVQRRKDAQKDAEKLRSEVARLKQQLSASDATSSELQAANADLRRQLKALQESAAASDGRPGGAASHNQQQQQQQLQQQLIQRDAEVRALRQHVVEIETQLQAGEVLSQAHDSRRVFTVGL